MKSLLVFAIMAFLLASPVMTLAAPTDTAVAKVYIYDRPEVSVSLTESEDKLICAWDITDLDKGDTFIAEVLWTKDGEEYATETVDCGSLKNCAALERPEPQPGEEWECSVTVKDSFDAQGRGSMEFYRAPLGFFGGLLESLLSFFGLA